MPSGKDSDALSDHLHMEFNSWKNKAGCLPPPKWICGTMLPVTGYLVLKSWLQLESLPEVGGCLGYWERPRTDLGGGDL